MKSAFRHLIVLCAVIPGFVPGLLHAAAPGRPAPNVLAERVSEADDFVERRYTGSIVAINRVMVTARVNGEMLDCMVKDGSRVEEGQVLFQIDPIRYEAAVKSAEAALAKSKAKQAYAQHNFDRNDRLYKSSAVSLDTWQTALEALEAVKADVMSSEAALVLAQDDLNNTKIVAPIAGLTGKVIVPPHNYIKTNDSLVLIVSTDPLRVLFSMSMRDFLNGFGNVENLRQNAEIKLKLADDQIYPQTGFVEIVDNEAIKTSDSVKIWARFPNPDNVLIPGSAATVMLNTNSKAKRPAVPAGAVMHDRNGAYVYVINGDIAERRNVRLGSANADIQLIAEGLQPGEMIVIEGTHKVIPGSKVIATVKGQD